MTTAAATLSPFALAHAELAPHGYSIIPCLPADSPLAGRGKCPADFQSGAWRPMPKWQEFATAPLHGFKLGLLLKADAANAGLLLGTSAGKDEDGRRLVVIAADIDARDPDVVDTLIRCLPASKMAKVGAVGRTVFLRASPDIKSASFDGEDGRILDLLCAGRQTVVPGSISPVTLAPYRWIGEPVAPDSLPIFTAGDLEVLLETLETVGWKREGRAPVKDRAPFVAADHDPDDLWSETKAAALSNLSAWVPALDLYGCRPARGGYEAVAHWRASSSGRAMAERKLNLSIQASGIKDFGTNDTYSAIDLVMSAQDVDQSAATSWLRERLGLDDVSNDVFVDVAALIASHEERDLPEPLRGLTAVPQLKTPAVESAREKTKGALGGPNTVASLRIDASHGVNAEMPAHLLRVPGALGQITDWIVDSARRPNPAFAMGAALVVLGTAAGRKIAGPTGSGTHLYVLGLADTGSGKDHALNAIPTLMCAAGLERHVGKGEFMSHQAVYTDLMQEPLTVCPMDEFGSFLRKINNRNGSGSEKAITGVLRTAWGKSFATMPSPGWATKASAPIHSPALSLFGAATDRDFFTAIDGADLDNGFLNRFLLIATKVRPQSVEPLVSRHTVPEAISDALVAIYNVASPLSRATMHSGGVTEPILTVGWSTPHVKQAFLAFENEVIERATADPMMARASEMAIRLATIRALGMQGVDDPVVCMDDLEWAMEFAMWSTERLIADAKEHMSENQTERDRAKIQRLIRAAGRITQRDLVRKTNGFTARQVEEITKLLEVAELIHIGVSPPGANGKKSKIYTWMGEQ